jgi:hypothetical protein
MTHYAYTGLEYAGRVFERRAKRNRSVNGWLPMDGNADRTPAIRWGPIRPWKPTSGKELSSSNIDALSARGNGSLWIGTDSGWSHLVDGDLIQYPDRPAGVAEIIQRARLCE